MWWKRSTHCGLFVNAADFVLFYEFIVRCAQNVSSVCAQAADSSPGISLTSVLNKFLPKRSIASPARWYTPSDSDLEISSLVSFLPTGSQTVVVKRAIWYTDTVVVFFRFFWPSSEKILQDKTESKFLRLSYCYHVEWSAGWRWTRPRHRRISPSRISVESKSSTDQSSRRRIFSASPPPHYKCPVFRRNH